MLHKMLSRLAKEFVFERAKRFAGSEFGNFVRHDLAIEAKKRLVFLPYDLKVKSSAGSGNWASVPWLAFFDPLVTSSATTGFYVVYLVNAQTEEIYLSLNQGTTEVYREFGESEKGRQILARRAIDLAERVPEYTKHFDTEAISLGSKDKLPAGYEAGHAFGRKYMAGRMNEVDFNRDFEIMLAAYKSLVDRGGRTPIDVMMEESGTTDIVETRSYVLSKRIERAQNVRVPVFQQRGVRCEACNLDPVLHYGYSGPLKNTPLDIHHAKPIRELSEGETRRYKVPHDFLVLCPTCHRMIHKQHDVSDLALLKSTIGFRLTRLH